MTGQTPAIPGPAPHRATATADRLDAAVRVVTGEPGCGRTWFLERAARAFAAGPVVRVRADPAGPAVPGGGLRPLLRALGEATGRAPAGGSGHALLDALRAGSGPLLVCVDDAHLWDPLSRAALGDAARHLCRTTTAARLLLTVPGHRPPAPEFAGLPVTRVDPLTPPEASALLDEVTGGALDGGVRDEIVDAAEGVPALLLALVRRLSPAQVRGDRPPPRPLPGAEVLTGVAGGCLDGLTPGRLDLLLTVAAAARDDEDTAVDRGLVLRAAGQLGQDGAVPLPELLAAADDEVRFHSEVLRRTVYAGAPEERRRAVHLALAGELAPGDPRALLHRAWAGAGRGRELEAVAGDLPSRRLRCAAYARAAELSEDGPRRAERYTAAAGQALLGGRTHQAMRLLDAARTGTAPAVVRGRAALLRGTTVLHDGPVDEAQACLLHATTLLADHSPADAGTAALAACDAAWAAGDPAGCLAALERCGETEGHGPRGGGPRADYRLGLRALLEARFEEAAVRLRRVARDPDGREPSGDPEDILRAAAAALMLGDLAGARRAGARALAAARTLDTVAAVPRAREYLAYAELRAGRHALARTHAEEGLRAAHRAGQRNTAAHQHAVLALAASIEGETELVAGHVAAALGTARRHGLAQAATLAEWAAARADLGRGRPQEAADRLGPLVRPGARRGHFALWMLAVPCYVEAAVSAGQSEGARSVVEEFALWAGFGADPQAPAQLLRCRALLAPADRADALYRQALDLHDTAGGDFERARTELLHGKWLRRRRRLREARDRLGAALVGFERCGARAWAEQTRGELRALGAEASGPRPAGAADLAGLTPQQLRIARRVAEGATNREVALTLSVSTRTVDYHLRKVFATLGVRSRLELARLVERAEKTGAHP
ncbi:LuxR C-terminal-related transcriptional regulator [Streptomyces bobili]|uniref:helix-turn-helix transcriptional regulator n=1 Tax=Streptomyces bobili TaxID=67280 RepID=UPI0022553975|nr:LuxR C-terminal-related transcriptional regulator [Streptomyces bobili]MCX5528206.1 LuxR C-terminal-related transcriptional regulator [Streptomyces bobili]